MPLKLPYEHAMKGVNYMVSPPWNVANVGGRDRAEAGTRVNRGREGYGKRERKEEEGGKVVDYEQSLFFLGPSSKSPETRQ